MAVMHPVSEELRRVACPAAEPIGDVRGSELPNTPGCRCRITHDSLSVASDAKTLVRWCANFGGLGPHPGEDFLDGYMGCPVWMFDKDRIAAGRKSFGDQREQEAQDIRTWRDDLTGSEYGDTSWMDEMSESVREARLAIEAGHTIVVGDEGEV